MVEFDRDIGERKEGRQRGMVKFLRDVFEGMKTEEEGRESELGFGTVSWRNDPSFVHIEYGFEEKSASPKATFEFRPAANTRQGGTTLQGSDIEELGGDAAKVGRFINGLGRLPLEFVELSAASLGHENLTNYEFEYETAVEKGRIDNTTFEEAARSTGII